MVQHLVDFQALIPILDQQLGDEILTWGTHVVPHRVIERDLLVDCFASDFFVVLTVEWQVATEHQVDYDAEGPTVDALVVWLLEKDLGCDIA